MVGLLLQSPRHLHMASDGGVPVVPMGAVSHYGKLDAQSVFVTVLPPLQLSSSCRVLWWVSRSPFSALLGVGNRVHSGVSDRVIFVRVFLDSMGVDKFMHVVYKADTVGKWTSNFLCFLY